MAATYAYDTLGRVTSVTDTHGGTSAATGYTYTNRGQLSTITGPGNKTWSVDYNDLGQPATVEEPNGMAVSYSYDARDRLSTITHLTQLTGGSETEKFTYTLDDGGLIDRITHLDNSYWDYDYDTRYRLTSAVRNNSGD